MISPSPGGLLGHEVRGCRAIQGLEVRGPGPWSTSERHLPGRSFARRLCVAEKHGILLMPLPEDKQRELCGQLNEQFRPMDVSIFARQGTGSGGRGTGRLS